MGENPLIGCWKLISCVAIRSHGNRVPVYGKNPIGRLYYDAAGNMSVHIMRPGRAGPEGVSDLACGDKPPDGVLGGYQAYFSTYSVNAELKIVRHEVLGSLYPNWTGSTQVRYYEMRDPDHLLLRSAPIGSRCRNGPIFELEWERIGAGTTVQVTEEMGLAHR
jgi:hypothetical protein